MKQYKSRDKITQKMTRDGLIEVNETQQTAERISKREQEADFQKSPEQPEQQAAQDGTQLQGVTSQTSRYPTRRELPRKGHRHSRARHGAYRNSTDPQSQ